MFNFLEREFDLLAYIQIEVSPIFKTQIDIKKTFEDVYEIKSEGY